MRKWSDDLDEYKVTRAEVATFLREGAEHLDRVGWFQGRLFAVDQALAPEAPMSKIWATSPCCGWGAIEAIRREAQPEMGTADYEADRARRTLAEDALSYAVGTFTHPRTPWVGHFPSWNDNTATAKEEVLALMRATADDVEAGRGVFA